MKMIYAFIFFSLNFVGVQAQTTSTTLPDSLSFVPASSIHLASMPVFIPNSISLLSRDTPFYDFTGGFIKSFRFNTDFNSIAPFYSRAFNPSSTTELESLLRRNYLLLDIHPLVNEY